MLDNATTHRLFSIQTMNASLMSAPHGYQRRWTQGAWALGSLFGVATLDWASGYEVSVFFLYVIPVALCTRYFGRVAGWSMALTAALVWMVADRWSGHQYSQEWIWYANALNRFLCFALAVWVVHYFEVRRAIMQRRLDAFGGERPVCSSCHSISDDKGYWWSMDNYLREFGGATPLSRVCPDCARHAYARGGYRQSA